MLKEEGRRNRFVYLDWNLNSNESRKKEEGIRKRFIYVDWNPNSKRPTCRNWVLSPTAVKVTEFEVQKT
jgi:hypothetical protein